MCQPTNHKRFHKKKTIHLIFLCTWVASLSAMENSIVPNWMSGDFCQREGQYTTLPWDCQGFLHCEYNRAHWINCPNNLKFDVENGACSSDIVCQDPKEVAAHYCPIYPTIVFKHPRSCAMYYDCSITTPNPQIGFDMYEGECRFPLLFDHVTLSCRNRTDVLCPKPPQRCEYLTEQCQDLRINANPCYGLPNGDYVDPEMTSLLDYVTCVGGSPTKRKCPEDEIFDPISNMCIMNSSLAVSLAVEYHCSGQQWMRFADQSKCSMYYDCSRKQHHPQLNNYQAECKYRSLYDPYTRSCVRFNHLPGGCGSRDEPKSPCQYRISCVQNGPCIPCSATCEGLPDGVHPFPRTGKTFKIACEAERTLGDFDKCSLREIFYEVKESCFTEPTIDSPVAAAHQLEETTTATSTAASTTDVAGTTANQESTTQNPQDATTQDPQATTTQNPQETTTVASNTEETTTQGTGTTANGEAGTTGDGGTTNSADTTTSDPGTATTVSGGTTADTTTSSNTGGSTTTAPETANLEECIDCNKNPELNEVKEDIKKLYTETENLHAKMDEAVKEPYDCQTPPPSNNTQLKFSYSKSTATATYTCDEGFTVCGTVPESTCTAKNVWTEVDGQCVQNLWVKFQTPVQKMTYECELTDDTVLTIEGRYTGKEFGILLTNPESTSTEAMVLSDNGRNIDYGKPDTLQNKKLAVPLHNVNNIKMTFQDGKMQVHINNEKVGDADHALNTVEPTVVEIQGGLQPERVEFTKEKVETQMDMEPLSINLAYKRPVVASSSLDLYHPGVITDGGNLVELGDNSCWVSKTIADDPKPYVTIDLGQHYYVSHVVLTSSYCPPPGCDQYTGNANVYVAVDTDVPNYSKKQLCSTLEAINDLGEVVNVTCDRPVVGRYVTVQAKEGGTETSTLNLCEAEVYGGHADTAEWTPFKCPNPPVLEYATVQVGYTVDAAVATYMCNDSHSTCYGSNIIHCYGPRGWDKAPEECVRTTFAANVGESVQNANVCPLRLGSGFEIWVTPKEDTGYIQLVDQDTNEVIFVMTLQMGDAAAPLKFQEDASITDNPFTKMKESHVVLSVLTDYILVEVDGQGIYQYPFDSERAMAADFLEANTGVQIREAKQYPEMYDIVQDLVYIEEETPENLALHKAYSASSKYLNPPDIAFDEGDALNYESGGCWHADTGDEQPWIQVDLGKEYFITAVELSVENVCPGCGSLNIAQSKLAFGSEDKDGSSSPDYLVDGLDSKNYTEKSCFASDVDGAWWMVDLGGSYLIEKLKLKEEMDSVDKFADLKIEVYSLNPKIFDTAPSTVCKTLTGAITVDQDVMCEKPVRGRYVMISKTEGADKMLKLCEVDIYATLADRLHDFDITVHETNPDLDRNPKLCHRFIGEFSVLNGKVMCKEPQAGRFVRLTGMDVDTYDDLVTVCEMKVFGATAAKKEWTPFDCPNPPLQPNSEVVVSRGSKRATAKYTCIEGYSHCGPDEIYCEGVHGWQGVPSACDKTSFSSNEQDGLLEVKLPCSLTLGEALEVTFTPTSSSDAEVSLLELRDTLEDKNVLSAGMKPQTMVIDLSKEGTPVNSPQTDTIVENRENGIRFTFLSDSMAIDIDGEYIGKVPVDHLVDFISGKFGRLRTVRVIPADKTDTRDRSQMTNLASSQQGLTVSTSDTGYDPALAVDDNTDKLEPNCWRAAENDMEPFLRIKLDKHYYIERVVISTRSDCTDTCAERTHDIKIEVFYKPHDSTTEAPQLCDYRTGVIPADTDETITCKDDVRGRYVKLSGMKRRDAADQLTFCEVQIFGGEVIHNNALNKLG